MRQDQGQPTELLPLRSPVRTKNEQEQRSGQQCRGGVPKHYDPGQDVVSAHSSEQAGQASPSTQLLSMCKRTTNVSPPGIFTEMFERSLSTSSTRPITTPLSVSGGLDFSHDPAGAIISRAATTILITYASGGCGQAAGRALRQLSQRQGYLGRRARTPVVSDPWQWLHHSPRLRCRPWPVSRAVRY